jgi:hypothetical protein
MYILLVEGLAILLLNKLVILLVRKADCVVKPVTVRQSCKAVAANITVAMMKHCCLGFSIPNFSFIIEQNNTACAGNQ